EVLKEPPRNAVGAADHHRGSADERFELMRQPRQMLRLDAQHDIVGTPHPAGRTGARPADADLAALGNAETRAENDIERGAASSQGHPPTGTIECVCQTSSDGTAPYDRD